MAKNASKSVRKDEATKIAAAVTQQLVDAIDREVDVDDMVSSRNAKLGTDGKMLMAKFQLAKRQGQPDPLCITVNDQVKWVKRGANVVLPWYFVEHMLHNVERKYYSKRDPMDANKHIILHDDMTTEQFNYSAINPAINPVTGQVFEIEGPREQPTQQPY